MKKFFLLILIISGLFHLALAEKGGGDQKISRSLEEVFGKDSIKWMVEQRIVYLEGRVADRNTRQKIVSQVRRMEDVDGVIDALSVPGNIPLDTLRRLPVPKELPKEPNFDELDAVFLKLNRSVPDSIEKNQYATAYMFLDASDSVLKEQALKLAKENKVADVVLKKKIRNILKQKIATDADNVKIMVDNSVAYLYGSVNSWKQREAVIRNAFAAGSGIVVTKLDINEPPPDLPTQKLLQYFR